MTAIVEVQLRNLQLAERVREHVQSRAGRLDHYLPSLDHIDVEPTHHASARQTQDRNVAQITARGRGFILRAEERDEDIRTAFDAGIDALRRQIERYKGRHYRGQHALARAAEPVEDETPPEDTGELAAPVVRRKKFRVAPMDELEAIEQMELLGHHAFFVFFNASSSRLAVLYKRRDGTYGLLEPELG